MSCLLNSNQSSQLHVMVFKGSSSRNFRADELATELTEYHNNGLKLYKNSKEIQKSQKGAWKSKVREDYNDLLLGKLEKHWAAVFQGDLN